MSKDSWSDWSNTDHNRSVPIAAKPENQVIQSQNHDGSIASYNITHEEHSIMRAMHKPFNGGQVKILRRDKKTSVTTSRTVFKENSEEAKLLALERQRQYNEMRAQIFDNPDVSNVALNAQVTKQAHKHHAKLSRNRNNHNTEQHKKKKQYSSQQQQQHTQPQQNHTIISNITLPDTTQEDDNNNNRPTNNHNNNILHDHDYAEYARYQQPRYSQPRYAPFYPMQGYQQQQQQQYNHYYNNHNNPYNQNHYNQPQSQPQQQPQQQKQQQQQQKTPFSNFEEEFPSL